MKRRAVPAEAELKKKIKADDKSLFLCFRLPEDIRSMLSKMSRDLADAREDVDHVTLLYLPSDEPVSKDSAERALEALRRLLAGFKPLIAKVQGWAYFDGAQVDGKTATALVVLLDSPGLAELHVAIKEKLDKVGFPADGQTHGYVPHATVAYLPHGARVDELPQLDMEFQIDRVEVVHEEEFEIELGSGNISIRDPEESDAEETEKEVITSPALENGGKLYPAQGLPGGSGILPESERKKPKLHVIETDKGVLDDDESAHKLSLPSKPPRSRVLEKGEETVVVAVPQEQTKRIALAPDTDPDNLTDLELRQAHWRLHHMLTDLRAGQKVKDFSLEDIVNLHARVVDTLYERGVRHPPPPDNGLDVRSDDFERFYEKQPRWDVPPKAVKKSLERKLAIVNPGSSDRNPVIYREDVLRHFQSFKAQKPMVYLVGSLAIHGQTEGDIDILVRGGGLTPILQKVVEFRLGRALPPELSKRLSVHFDSMRGPFTSHVPLFDLIFERLPVDEVIEMREFLEEEIEQRVNQENFSGDPKNLSHDHNEKKVEFYEEAVSFARKGGLVLEAFAGSGGSVIANLPGRAHLAIEKDKARVTGYRRRHKGVEVICGDNVKILGELDLGDVTVADFDASGSPFEAFAAWVAKYKSSKGHTIVFLTWGFKWFQPNKSYNRKKALSKLKQRVNSECKKNGLTAKFLGWGHPKGRIVIYSAFSVVASEGKHPDLEKEIFPEEETTKRQIILEASFESEARQSEREDEVKLGRFFYQPKPTRAAFTEELQSIERLVELYKERAKKWLPAFVQKKYDGCFPKYAKVETELGRLPIGEIVRTRAKIRVKSYNWDTGEIEWKPIIDWFDNGHAEEYVRIQVAGSKSSITCTPNHLIYLEDGRKVIAEKIKPGDRICYRAAKLSRQQDLFVRGSLLGDAGLARTKVRKYPSLPMLNISHSLKQSAYLEWKSELLSVLGGRISERTSQFGFPGLRWISRADASLLSIWNELYPEGRKILSSEFLRTLGAPSYASWIMDDGSLAWNVQPRLHLHTEGFGLEGTRLIQSYFKTEGFFSAVYESRNYYYLGFDVGSTRALLDQSKPWFCKSMAYKSGSDDPVGFGWEDASAPTETIVGREVVEVYRFVPSRSFGRYDIKVADNHNYFVKEVLVSNSNHQIHKDGEKVLIISEDGGDNTHRLPGVVKEVRALKADKLVLVTEIEKWDGRQHLPREVAAGYLNAKTPADDSSLVANIYDVLYLGDDIHEKPTSARMKILQALGIKQNTLGVPDLKHRLNAAPSIEVGNLTELERAARRISRLSGSEGIVAKQSDANYPLSEETEDLWVKYHNATTIRGVVLGREPVEKAKAWVYQWGVLPGKEKSKRSVMVGREEVVPVGDTFSTSLDLAKGDHILVEAETVNIVRSPEGVSITAWVPRAIEEWADKPDTVDSATSRARQNLVLQEKDIDAHGKVTYRPTRKVVEKQEDPYMELPEKQRTPFTIHNHWRGKSVHADLRIGLRTNKLLVGWTLNTQIAGSVDDPVVTLAMARAIARDMDDFSKIDWSTGEWAERAKRGVKKPVRTSILCERKAPEPWEWINVEGKTKEPKEGEPPPVGGTRNFPGVFHIVEKGEVEFGAQKPWFHEYFVYGRHNRYRLIFRQLTLKEATEKAILPPSVGQEGVPADARRWFAMRPGDLTPYVLDSDAVKKGWVPPVGVSALPGVVEKQVPKEHRYWEAKSEKATQVRRDALVEAVKADEVELNFEAPYRHSVQKASLLDARFVLQRQTWKGPAVVRAGPSRTLFWLRVDTGRPELTVLEFLRNPVDNPKLAAQVKTDEHKDSMDFKGDIKPGHYLNPTKDTPSKIETVDGGKASVLAIGNDFIKLKLEGKKLKDVFEVVRNPDAKEWLFQPAKTEPDVEKADTLVPIAKVDKEKHEIVGIVLEPDEVDAQGDTISADRIEKAAHLFLAKFNRETELGIMHKLFGRIGIELFESWVAPIDLELGGQPVKAGSWLMTIHVLDKSLWRKVKNGEITGLSIGGIASII